MFTLISLPKLFIRCDKYVTITVNSPVEQTVIFKITGIVPAGKTDIERIKLFYVDIVTAFVDHLKKHFLKTGFLCQIR